MKNRRLCYKRKREMASGARKYFDDTYIETRTAEKQDEVDDQGSQSDSDCAVIGHISPYRETNEESISSPPAMQQICYKENIERFFASQPKTYSDGSDDFNKNEKSSSSEDYQASSSGSGNGSSNTKERQSASPNYDNKASGSNSSSKGNMCSYNTGDSGYGKSWGKDSKIEPGSSQQSPTAENRMENSPENEQGNEQSITFASCLALTEETLSAHNKINHKQAKQRNSSSTFTKITVPMKEMKRKIADDGHSKAKKVLRGHNLKSSTPVITNSAKKTTTSARNAYKCSKSNQDRSNKRKASRCVTNTTHSCHQQQNTCATSPFFIPVFYMGSMPCYPAMNPFWSCAATQNNQNSPDGFSLNQTCNIHGNPMVPNFPYPTCPSFLNTPNCNHTVRSSGVTTTSSHCTTTTTVASETSTTYKDTMAGERSPIVSKISDDVRKKNKEQESFESSIQTEESLSSFTKSSSQKSQDKFEDMDLDDKKFYTASNTNKVGLSSEIAFRYQMDVSNVDDILKKDREVLKSMQQPDLVNKQLGLLQNEIKDENEMKPKAEDDFTITEEIMLGLTTEESVNEDLEQRETSLLQLMCGEL